ncbi:MAG: PQQ-dependent sugar dehydrogenase [Alphaproteobacteria bacterium]
MPYRTSALRSFPLALGALPLLLSAGATAETVFESRHHKLQVETVANGLEHPWAIALLPDGRFLVTERNSGRLRLGGESGTLSDAVEGVPEIFRHPGETGRSQGGLFDVKLHPDFAENGLIYLSYSKPTERGTGVAVARGRLAATDGAPRLEDVEDIFVMKEDDQDSSGLHFGGRMAIDPDGRHLFLSIGERRNISRAQDNEDQAGSILRLDLDGGTPSDNPFASEDVTGDPAIWSYGHRNPQGLGFEPATGALWANEHGPLRGDEINRIEPGNNYGWPYITGGRDYSGAAIGEGTEREGMTSAVHIFEETVAPSGLAFYHGDLFPQWQGDMLNGGLAAKALVRVRLEGGSVVEEEHLLADFGRRIRDVQVASDGAIWMVTDHSDGEVLRLVTAD